MKRKFSIMYSSLESNSKKNLLVEKNYEEKNYQKNFIGNVFTLNMLTKMYYF